MIELICQTIDGELIGKYDKNTEHITIWFEGVILPDGISEFANLKKLWLGYNRLTSLSIWNSINLTEIVVSDNLLTSIPSEIGNLVNLQVLKLSFNSLMYISPEIGKLTNLRFIYFCMIMI